MNESTHLDLFSGIGGFALAAQWAGFRTVAFVEIDKYCQKVLAKNFGAVPVGDTVSAEWRPDDERERRSSEGQHGQGQTPSGISESGEDVADAGKRDGGSGRQGRSEHDGQGLCESQRPYIHCDIFDFDGTAYRGVDLITGGFPCQPFSVAGKRRGASDDRAIWPQMFRVISEARPAWVLGENVPGIIPMELDNVLSDLEGIGYATWTFVIPACAVDARHRRDRVWIVGRLMADAENSYRGRTNGTNNGRRRDSQTRGCGEPRGGVQYWEPEPDMGRVAHGIPSRVDRLKGLGNAIVPQVAYEILREIRKLC